MKSIKYIKKVEIKNLWNKYDIEWNLNEDVNILAGKNGSGKTTILDLIAGTINGKLENHVANMVDNVKITFNNDKYITYQKINDTIENLEKDEQLNKFVTEFKQREGRDFSKIHTVKGAIFSYQDLGMTKEELREILVISIVSTFDQQLQVREIVRKLDEDINTELDFQIFLLQKRYIEYQLNIGKQAIKALSSKQTVNDVQIDFHKNLFLDTIDILFGPTGKKIDRNENELVFKLGKQVLTPYVLSSGEKQLIIILLTALIQEDKNFVLLMDEPEISLHTYWQEKLIKNILSLNNNNQIIIATHSPSIVLDGWMDKVFGIPEMITKKL